MLSIGKTFEFSAAHRLFRSDWSEEKNVQTFGKCANLNGHGHNYRLEVLVTGPQSMETGMIFDASLLDDIVKRAVIAPLDHKNLDKDVSWLEGKITTVENLVESIWEQIAFIVQKEHPQHSVSEVKLWETGRIFAVKRA